MDTVSIDSRSLYQQLGHERAPLILDVRREAAFAADERMIAGAIRAAAEDPLPALSRHPVRHPVVVYCVAGHEVSQGAAARLRERGFDARSLAGGIEAWKAAGLPTLRKRPDWRVPGGSRWITREHPKVDRVACPWLIRRFVDPLATFHYVPKAQVFTEAESRLAIPYDTPGAIVNHRGERCSFDALIEDFDLHDGPLDRLATIVRGADTDRLDLAPQCEGLLATSMELSRRHPDDHDMLAHAMPVYDALYAQCRRQATMPA